MRLTPSRIVRFVLSVAGIGMLAAVLVAQATKGGNPGIKHVALTEDWSDHHIIFTRPENVEQAMKVQRDPRYWKQLYRHAAGSVKTLSAPGTLGAPSFAPPNVGAGHGAAPSHRPHRKCSAFRTNAAAHKTGACRSAPAGASGTPTTRQKSHSMSPTQGVAAILSSITPTLLARRRTPSIFALTNLYTSCSGTVPTVLWAYNTTQLRRRDHDLCGSFPRWNQVRVH